MCRDLFCAGAQDTAKCHRYLLIDSLKEAHLELPLLAVLLGGATTLSCFSLGMELEPLAIGLLTSSVALLVLRTVFDMVWKVMTIY
jgi:hypothetical protein